MKFCKKSQNLITIQGCFHPRQHFINSRKMDAISNGQVKEITNGKKDFL